MRMFVWMLAVAALFASFGCSAGPGLEPMEMVSTYDEAQAKRAQEQAELAAQSGEMDSEQMDVAASSASSEI